MYKNSLFQYPCWHKDTKNGLNIQIIFKIRGIQRALFVMIWKVSG